MCSQSKPETLNKNKDGFSTGKGGMGGSLRVSISEGSIMLKLFIGCYSTVNKRLGKTYLPVSDDRIVFLF